MAGILLDVDGVLHVSGAPIPGAAEAVAQLRENGHRLRFVTNNTTHSRRRLADQIRSFGIQLEDEELQTTPVAAADIDARGNPARAKAPAGNGRLGRGSPVVAHAVPHDGQAALGPR